LLKILFVCSGSNGISPIVAAQAASLAELGVKVDFFPIQENGIAGYLKHILPLRKVLWQKDYDVIHAHYSLSAYVASLAGAKQLVVSLMGSDTKLGFLGEMIIHLFGHLFRWQIILKSQDMNKHLKLQHPVVIPNGVNFSLFKPADRDQAREKLNWSKGKRHILFAANPARYEKNFSLSQKAVALLQFGNCELHYLDKVPHEKMHDWYNAADILLLTSLWEGSPNVVKEAMACNCPVVSTDVGDIRWLFGDTPGHFIADFTPEDTAAKIGEALAFVEKNGKANGREQLIELGLDANTIAKRIVDVYQNLVRK
jgi:teichuronic acid biosynthesis glycosyltransferase TuaC